MKDWTGSQLSLFKNLGASSHSRQKREIYDYYATEPLAVELLLNLENFNNNIWECACGELHISNVLLKKNYKVRNSDIINRCNNEIYDFLNKENKFWNGDIITNPPYKFTSEFIKKAINIIPEGNKIAFFLPIQYLEGKKRRKIFDCHPPLRIWISSSRLNCAKNGQFNKKIRSARCYAWFVWQKGYKGETMLKWFN